MSTMQVFYMDLTKTIASGEGKTEMSVKKKDVLTAAVFPDTYHEKLARLTRLTLAELNDDREQLGWVGWW